MRFYPGCVCCGVTTDCYLSSSTSDSLTFTRLGGTMGDLYFAVIQYANSGSRTITPPAGWTELQSGTLPGGSVTSYWVGYRVLQSGDSETITWTFSSSDTIIAQMFRLADYDAPTASTENSGSSGTTLTALSCSVAEDDSLAVVCYFNERIGILIGFISSSDSELCEPSYITDTLRGQLCRQFIADTPSTGNRSAAQTQSAKWAAVMAVMPPRGEA